MAVSTAPARDLSPTESKRRQEDCYKLEQEIKEGLKAGRALMWATAKALHDFDEAQGWSALGHERLSDWLSDPEIGMTRATYYRMVSAYREIVVLRRVPHEDLPELDVSKVQIVLPALKSGDVKLTGALKDIRSLGWRDLREQYMKPKDTGTSSVEPEPDPTEDADDPVTPPDFDTMVPPTRVEELVPDADGAEFGPEVESVHGTIVVAPMSISECLDSLRATLASELPNVHSALGACEQAVEVLERVHTLLRRTLDEVGRPEQKKMRRDLREKIEETI